MVVVWMCVCRMDVPGRFWGQREVIQCKGGSKNKWTILYFSGYCLCFGCTEISALNFNFNLIWGTTIEYVFWETLIHLKGGVLCSVV